MVIDGENRLNICPERTHVLLGQYKLKFTGRGRVILPKKLRQEIGLGGIILTRGFEKCVFGYEEGEFEKEALKQLETSASEERARSLRRYLFSGSVRVELDDQGRFVIPDSLLEFADIKTEVVIIGAGDHFEIWENSLWQKYLKTMEGEYGRIS